MCMQAWNWAATESLTCGCWCLQCAKNCMLFELLRIKCNGLCTELKLNIELEGGSHNPLDQVSWVPGFCGKPTGNWSVNDSESPSWTERPLEQLTALQQWTDTICGVNNSCGTSACHVSTSKPHLQHGKSIILVTRDSSGLQQLSWDVPSKSWAPQTWWAVFPLSLTLLVPHHLLGWSWTATSLLCQSCGMLTFTHDLLVSDLTSLLEEISYFIGFVLLCLSV